MPNPKKKIDIDPAHIVQKLEEEDLRRKLKRSFYEFLKFIWPVMDSGREMIESWHYELMCEWVEYAESGKMKQDNPNSTGVWFCVPPGTGKSLQVTIAFPCWLQLRDPKTRIGCVSHSDDIATPMSVKRRTVLESEEFKRLRPGYKIREDSNLKTRQDNNYGGLLVAGTRKAGVVTGIRLSHIVLDDLLKVHERTSDAFRNEANKLYDETLRSRFDSPDRYFLGISQRLHPSDIVGFLKRVEPERWHFVEIPLICEEDTEYVFPVSGRKHLRKKGDVIRPDKFPPHEIVGLQKNPVQFAGQQQQKPSPEGGIIFPTQCWRFYEKPPDTFDLTVMSVDAAFKGGPGSDYVAIHVYGTQGPNRFLLDKRTERLDYPATKKAILDMRNKYPSVSYTLIEDKANGSAIVSELRNEVPGVVAINPEGGKESRANSASSDVYSGNVYLPSPEKYTWVQPMLDNFSDYGGEGTVDHDDDIDAFTQFINWARQLSSGVGVWINQQYEQLQKTNPGSLDATDLCPVCHKQVTYMSGIWTCQHCKQASGRDQGSSRIVTRVGF